MKQAELPVLLRFLLLAYLAHLYQLLLVIYISYWTSSSSGGMDLFWGVWVRQQQFFSYSKPPASVLPERSPLQLFSQFFTDEVFDLLVVVINRYAATVCGTSCHARP